MSFYNTSHFYGLGNFCVDKNLLMYTFISLDDLMMYSN